MRRLAAAAVIAALAGWPVAALATDVDKKISNDPDMQAYLSGKSFRIEAVKKDYPSIPDVVTFRAGKLEWQRGRDVESKEYVVDSKGNIDVAATYIDNDGRFDKTTSQLTWNGARYSMETAAAAAPEPPPALPVSSEPAPEASS